ncbi:MAG: ABC transporter permease [Candidatus Nanopelagicales bacterium]|nr:ABC transporter permease [Candidatus Nanopelagicales bacterium]
MNLALTEMRRAKLRFGLLTAAVALLVFLIVFLASLSGALLRAFTGAIESLPADGLVYSETARANAQASRLAPDTVGQVAEVAGVAAAGPMAVLSANAIVAGEPDELQLIGVQPGSPSQPEGLREGRFPEAADEVAIDASDAEVGIGDTVRINGTSTDLTVVGRMVGTQFGTDTAWVPITGYEAVLRELNPALPAVPINVVAFTVDEGADAAEVAAQVQQAVEGTQALDRAAAVEAIPGVESVGQTFGLLVGITFVIGVVVVGFFFLILTVQKLRSFTLLRATGASTGSLAGSVVTQITAVVLLASAIATALAWFALQALSTGLPVRIDPLTTGGVVAAVLLASLVAGLLSVRRIAQLDPATAAGAR